MDVQEALRDAPNFLKNAEDLAQRDPANPDTLYMWDNQVVAIEAFLTNTEDVAGADGGLDEARGKLRDLKKAIQNKVLEFELKQDGEELPPEPTEDELVGDMTEFGKELAEMCVEIEKLEIDSVEKVNELEEPRQQLNAFLADTETLVGKSKDLDTSRAAIKQTRDGLELRVDELVREWRKMDLAAGAE